MRAALVVVGLTAVFVAACGGDTTADDGRVAVVGSFFPLAEVARQVGGDDVRVTDLTPTGAEPHDLELTTRQADAIQDAAVVVVMGDDFQPAVEHIAGRRDGATVEVLDALAIDEDDRDDPHVWLDPVAMQDIVAVVRDALTEVDPRNAATYRANAARYRSQLQGLDDEYATALANCDRNDIVTSHESFGWLARRYGLEQHAVAGLSPDEEPSADRIAELTDLADENDVTTIFTEELVSPRIARTLAREAGGLQTATLDPFEGSPDADADAPDSGYIAVMRRNLRTLREALGCR